MEGVSDVANVNEVALKMLLKKDNAAILARAESEVVDEKIQPHAGRYTKYSGEAKGDGPARGEELFFTLNFELAIERDGIERRFFCAECLLFCYAVTAVRVGIKNGLRRAGVAKESENRIIVKLSGKERISVASGCADDSSEWNNDIGCFEFLLQKGLIASMWSTSVRCLCWTSLLMKSRLPIQFQ